MLQNMMHIYVFVYIILYGSVLVLQAVKTCIGFLLSSRIVFSKIFIVKILQHIQNSLRKVACLIYILLSIWDMTLFILFQICFGMFFVQLGLEVIEIHLQINKIISAIRNFKINIPKNRN